jgi:predicted DNA-binding transcriptional regulator AlpA
MNQHVSADHGALIPKTSLAHELGVSSRTLSRWLKDGSIDFPRPVIIRGRNYFDRISVEGWKAGRVRASVRIAPPALMGAA